MSSIGHEACPGTLDIYQLAAIFSFAEFVAQPRWLEFHMADG